MPQRLFWRYKPVALRPDADVTSIWLDFETGDCVSGANFAQGLAGPRAVFTSTDSAFTPPSDQSECAVIWARSPSKAIRTFETLQVMIRRSPQCSTPLAAFRP